MTTRQSRSGRLSRSAEFDRAFRRGRSYASKDLVLYAFRCEQGGPARLGMTVSRKVGSAVERNLVKRLLRESFKHLAADVSGYDLVLVAREGAAELARNKGLAGIEAATSELLVRASILRRDAETPQAA